MNGDIYLEARQHFLESGQRYEYGRSDMKLDNRGGNGKTDSSRSEQDNDKDGMRGVDCSSFVWRALKDAGYDVPDQRFTTATLFKGAEVTSYAKKHFETISGADARKPQGELEQGDLLLFRKKGGSSQHVAIFKGYDKDGNIEFLGSQVSKGPAEETVRPGGYWDGSKMEIVGALRAKPEFHVKEAVPLTAHAESPHAKSLPTEATQAATSELHHGSSGSSVRQLQAQMVELGYMAKHDQQLTDAAHFGPKTLAAVHAFERDHHLAGTGRIDAATHHAISDAVAAKRSTSRQEVMPLTDGRHPDHALFEQALKGVKKIDTDMGRTSDQASVNLAAALTVEAKKQGLSRIDAVAISSDGSQTLARGSQDLQQRLVDVGTAQAVHTSVEHSSAALKTMENPATATHAAGQALEHRATQATNVAHAM